MPTAFRMGMAALALLATIPARAQQPQPVPEPGGLMRTIAMQPFRYGGDLDGSLLGLPEVGTRPVHLAIGLGAPSRDGQVQGNAILFDGQRHLLAEGRVDGMLQTQPGGGIAPCALRLQLDGVVLADGAPAASVLPAGGVLLTGSCSSNTLSGEIRARPPRLPLLGRLISWWGDRETTGRYWLTADSFDPAPRDVAPAS